MKSRTLTFITAMTLYAAAPTAVASTTWYVNGVSGSDSNNCLSATTACKTIGHAISLAVSGDSIVVAPATYTENLMLGKNLTIVGSGASTTIIDGGGAGTVVTIITSSAVALSKLTVRNGFAQFGTGMLLPCIVFCPTSRCSAYGGGIAVGGTMAIASSTLARNLATCRGNCRAFGGGVEIFGTATIQNSIIANSLTETAKARSRQMGTT